MAYQWFKMQASFAFDPKFQMLSEQAQRRYVVLLCARCGGAFPRLEEASGDELAALRAKAAKRAAFILRVTEAQWLKTAAELTDAGLLDERYDFTAETQDATSGEAEESRIPLTGAERARRFRANQKRTGACGSGQTVTERNEGVTLRVTTEEKKKERYIKEKKERNAAAASALPSAVEGRAAAVKGSAPLAGNPPCSSIPICNDAPKRAPVSRSCYGGPPIPLGAIIKDDALTAMFAKIDKAEEAHNAYWEKREAAAASRASPSEEHDDLVQSHNLGADGCG